LAAVFDRDLHKVTAPPYLFQHLEDLLHLRAQGGATASQHGETDGGWNFFRTSTHCRALSTVPFIATAAQHARACCS